MGNLDFIGRIAEQKIQEAMDEGKFDDLPGKGKPIIFDDDPLTPPHLRLVNRILKNANVLPEWVQVQKDILSDRKQVCDMRSRLIRENGKWGVRLARLSAGHAAARQYVDWHAKSRAAYLRQLKSVNNAILKFTLIAPRTAQPFASYKIQAELDSFDADFTSHVIQKAAAEREARG